MSKKRVLIVSRYPLFDQGLRSALQQQPGVEVVGVYRDPKTAAAHLADLNPDVVLAIAGAEATGDEAFQPLKDGPACFIQISPTDGSMNVYQRQRVDRATLDDLLAAIQLATQEMSRQETAAGPPVVAGGTQLKRRRNGMKHFLVIAVLVAISTVLMTLLLGEMWAFPQAASTQSAYVDQLMDLQIYVIAFLFSLIVVLMVYSVIVFRRRPGDESDGAHITGSTRLEILWTVVPLITVVVFATLGSQYLTEMTRPQANELVVEVTGAQFAWTFAYPNHGVTGAELVLPVDRPVLFRITSVDVIHSFWVPEFRVKQDAVPDRVTALRITPTEIGQYQVMCAEMCGTAHAYMLAPVRVVSQADFEAWLSGRLSGVPAGGPEQGAQLAEASGCLSCHTLDGAPSVGPTWQDLFGSERPLANGPTVTADEEYLRESILEPGAKVVEGFADVMPRTYDQTLSDADVMALVDYIQSLSQ